MPFALVWLEESANTFVELEAAARKSLENRLRSKKAKVSKKEGLFKLVLKCVALLIANARHPDLNTHEYDSIENPYDPATKVFEAYVQIQLLCWRFVKRATLSAVQFWYSILNNSQYLKTMLNYNNRLTP